MRAASTPEIQRLTYERYTEAFRRDPNDLLLGLNYAKLLEMIGQRNVSQAVWQRLIATQPPFEEGAPNALPDAGQ